MALAMVALSSVLAAPLYAQSETNPPAEKPAKHLLPYVEAKGSVNATFNTGWPLMQWLDSTRLLFIAEKSPSIVGGKARPLRETVGDLTRENNAEHFQVLLFDVTEKTTKHHMDGKLAISMDKDLKFDGHDRITISQESLGPPVPRPGEPPDPRSFGRGMRGPFGQEQPYFVYAKDVVPYVAKSCPGFEGTKTRSVFLKPEHGCLLQPGSNVPEEAPMIHVRADGSRMDIDLQRKDFSMAYWIEWLGAYLLSDSNSRSVKTHKIFPLMKPDGRMLAIPFLGRWTPNYVRPTRAGIVGTIGSAQYNGVFLMRDGKIVQLADGRVHPQVVVSPDGCHVAYIADIPSLFSFQIAYRRLRVLDVCASLDIPPTSNPFVWPTEVNPTSSEK